MGGGDPEMIKSVSEIFLFSEWESPLVPLVLLSTRMPGGVREIRGGQELAERAPLS